MLASSLPWQGPFPLAETDFSSVPPRPGVYVFTEYPTALLPNPLLPPPGSPAYESEMARLRRALTVLYVGKATSLASRLPGYRFRPYLEIVRRPHGSPPRHQADRHKGRALLHAQQFFEGPVFLRWAETDSPAQAEAALIRELRPVLNTLLPPAE